MVTVDPNFGCLWVDGREVFWNVSKDAKTHRRKGMGHEME